MSIKINLREKDFARPWRKPGKDITRPEGFGHRRIWIQSFEHNPRNVSRALQNLAKRRKINWGATLTSPLESNSKAMCRKGMGFAASLMNRLTNGATHAFMLGEDRDNDVNAKRVRERCFRNVRGRSTRCEESYASSPVLFNKGRDGSDERVENLMFR